MSTSSATMNKTHPIAASIDSESPGPILLTCGLRMDHTNFPQSVQRISTLDIPTLISQLNALLASLRIPISLISPTDLTPSFLVAILESLMGMRIPVIERSNNSQLSKVQNMKVFLGVLETDFLQMDVGLSQLDPRRLANGEREEVFYIAELLCWIGREMKLIKKNTKSTSLPRCDVTPKLPSNVLDSIIDCPALTPATQAQPLSLRSQLDIDAASVFQTGSATMDSIHHNISTFTSRLLNNESSNTIDTIDHPLPQAPYQSKSRNPSHMDEKEEGALPMISDFHSASSESHERDPPRCIHEVPSLLSCFAHDTSCSTPPRAYFLREGQKCCPEHSIESRSCDLSVLPIRSPPVRYSGHIELIDEETEIASFELSRSKSPPLSYKPGLQQPSPTDKSVREQYARTLRLLNERAQILNQLSKLENSDCNG